MGGGRGEFAVGGFIQKGGQGVTELAEFAPKQEKLDGEAGAFEDGAGDGEADARDDGAHARPEIGGVGTKHGRGGRGVHVFMIN